MTMDIVERSLTIAECRNEDFQPFEVHPFWDPLFLGSDVSGWMEDPDAWRARQQAEPTRRVTVLDLAGALVGLAGLEGNEPFNHVRRLLEQGARTIVMNLKAITTVDSSGLAELVRCYVVIARAGGTLHVVNAPSHFQKLVLDLKLL